MMHVWEMGIHTYVWHGKQVTRLTPLGNDLLKKEIPVIGSEVLDHHISYMNPCVWYQKGQYLQRPPDLTNLLGQANYTLNPEIRYNRIFYEVKFIFTWKIIR